jgi:hypothetical protein
MEDYYGTSTRPAETTVSYGLPPVPTSTKPAKRSIPLGPILFVVIGLVIGFFAVGFLKGNADPPTEEEVSAAFTPISGYTYLDVPDAQLQPMRDAIASEPDLEEGIAVFQARQVQVGSQTVAAVIILGIDPDEFKGSYREDFLAGFRAGSGAEATPIKLGGEDAYSGEASGGHFIAFFDESDGLIFLVIGATDPSVKSIAEQIHAGNASTS